jgi:hypothetical protein
MLPARGLDREFFAGLDKMDAAIASAVRAAGCRHCEGPLHQGNYQRKPRGALISGAGEAFTVRYSLCCGRRGCRKRSLPPSVRFLGRRVYLEVVVVLAVAFVQAVGAVGRAVTASGVPRRTLQRWGAWWREAFPRLPTWVALRARFAPPPPDEASLPRSLYQRIGSDLLRADRSRGDPTQSEVMVLLARCLAPATTGSVLDGSRFLGAVAATG